MNQKYKPIDLTITAVYYSPKKTINIGDTVKIKETGETAFVMGFVDNHNFMRCRGMNGVPINVLFTLNDIEPADALPEPEFDISQYLETLPCLRTAFSPITGECRITSASINSTYINVSASDHPAYCFFKNGRREPSGHPILFPNIDLFRKYPLQCRDAWDEYYLIHCNSRWRAEKGQSYWCINTVGTVSDIVEQYDTMSDHRYNFGNYFRTQKAAEYACMKMKALLLDMPTEFKQL